MASHLCWAPQEQTRDKVFKAGFSREENQYDTVLMIADCPTQFWRLRSPPVRHLHARDPGESAAYFDALRVRELRVEIPLQVQEHRGRESSAAAPR